MAQRVGHNVDPATLEPLHLSSSAQRIYDMFKAECKQLSKEIEAYRKPTVQKHFFQSTSPSIVSHVHAQCGLERDAMPADWNVMSPADVLCLPSWLAHQLYSLNVIKNEMALPLDLRSNPPVELSNLPRPGSDSQEKCLPQFICEGAVNT